MVAWSVSPPRALHRRQSSGLVVLPPSAAAAPARAASRARLLAATIGGANDACYGRGIAGTVATRYPKVLQSIDVVYIIAGGRGRHIALAAADLGGGGAVGKADCPRCRSGVETAPAGGR